MPNEEKRMPRDRWLVQESLKKISEGPDALMKWASEHYNEIDQKFMNLLRKMSKFSQENKQYETAKLFQFLESCFMKMFKFSEGDGTITVFNENFRELLDKATGDLKKGKVQEAIRTLQALLLFLGHSPNPRYEAIVDANLGIAYAQDNRKEKAVDYLLRAISLSENDQDKEKILANLGTIHRDLTQYDQALECYQKSLEIARIRGDKEMEVVHLNGLALINMDKQNLPKAIALQEEAYALAQKTENKILLQDCITRLAMIMAIYGDKDRCKDLCNKGLKMLSPEPDQKPFNNV